MHAASPQEREAWVADSLAALGLAALGLAASGLGDLLAVDQVEGRDGQATLTAQQVSGHWSWHPAWTLGTGAAGGTRAWVLAGLGLFSASAQA